MTEMIGYPPDALLGKHWTEFVDPETLDDVEELVFQNYHKTPGRFETVFIARDGRQVPVLVSTRPLFDGEIYTGALAVLTDITQQKQSEENLRYLATHDRLTDLPNRYLFHDRLKHALARAERNGEIVIVMLLDLDNFKTINDTMGHDKGDLVLQTVAERLKKSMRQSDTVARMGGDEFTVVLENTTKPGESTTVALKIQEFLSQPFQLDSQELNITASIGISIYPDDGDGVETLLKNADIAMYQAKEQRDSYRYFNSNNLEG